MPILKGTEKVEKVRITASIPKSLAERIRRYVEYMDERGQIITEDEIIIQAVTYALNSDKDFTAWEGRPRRSSRQEARAAEKPEPVMAS